MNAALFLVYSLSSSDKPNAGPSYQLCVVVTAHIKTNNKLILENCENNYLIPKIQYDSFLNTVHFKVLGTNTLERIQNTASLNENMFCELWRCLAFIKLRGRF